MTNMLRILIVVVLIQQVLSLSEFGKYLKSSFQKQFDDKCTKYPFIGNYQNKLETSKDPSNRYINFVYQAPGFRNGGLGDRIGGLVSAAAIAVRFNRTLVIRNSNSLGDFMKPYHPLDSGDNPKYNYNNWSWSGYDFHNENADRTEYDIWMCINNVGNTMGQCSINQANDRSEPNILYRSNRAYLCYYSNSNPNRADMQLLGVNSTANLFEIAGCLLRMVWWPTNALWEEVDKIYQDYWRSHHKALQTTTEETEGESRGEPQRRSKRRRKLKRSSSTIKHEETNKAVKTRVMRGEGSHRDLAIDGGTGATIAESQHPDIWHPGVNDKYLQIGMHFRCGDQSYLQHGGFDSHCVWNPNNNDPKYIQNMKLGNPTQIAQCGRDIMLNMSNRNTASSSKNHEDISGSSDANEEEATTTTSVNTNEESINGNTSKEQEWLKIQEETFFNAAFRPKLAGSFDGSDTIAMAEFCSLSEKEFDDVLSLHVPSFADKGKIRHLCAVYKTVESQVGAKAWRQRTRHRRRNLQDESFAPGMASNFVKELLYIASDNIKASESMAKEAGHPYSIISPQGCHIELDPTPECHLFTLSNWLVLAMSDKIVTQDLGEKGMPTSSFSRYAGIYGLKDDVFRTGTNCERVVHNEDMSHWQQSNWFC